MGWFNRENEVDEFFKEGLNVEYPYNPQLWSRLASILDRNYTRFLRFNGIIGNIGLMIAVLPLLFFTSNNPIVKQSNFTLKLFGNTTAILSLQTPQNLTQPAETYAEEFYDLNNTDTKIGHSHQSNKTFAENKISNAPSQNNVVRNKFDSRERQENEQYAYTVVNPSIDQLKRELIYADYEYSPLRTPLLTEISPYEMQNIKQKKQSIDVAIIAEQSLRISRSLEFNEPPTEAQNADIKATGKSTYGLELIKNYKAFRVGIGLRISEFSENVSYSNNSTESNYQIFYDTAYTVINDSYDENGKPVILIRQDINARVEENTNTLEENVSVRNTFRRLQLPITVGFEKRFGKITAGIRSGVIVNYALSQNGTYFNPNSMQYSTLKENAPQINPVFIGQASTAEVGFVLNNSLVLGASYSYEADLGSFRTDNTSRFQSQNFGVWIRWKLDKH